MKKTMITWAAVFAMIIGMMQNPFLCQAAVQNSRDYDEETVVSRKVLENEKFTDSVSAGPTFSGVTYKEGDWTYQVSGGQAGILHYDGTDAVVSIPDFLGGYPVVSLGYYTFAGEYVPIPMLGTGFYEANKTIVSLKISASVSELNTRLFDYLDVLETIQVDAANRTYASQDGVLFSKDRGIIYYYPEGKKDSSYTIPATVKEVAEACFCGNDFIEALDCNRVQKLAYRAVNTCESLKSVDLGDAYQGTGSRPEIYNCKSLQEISIPATAKVLDEVYDSCPALAVLTVQTGNANYVSEGNIIFSKDKSKLVMYAPNRPGTQYTVPETVREICAHAFADSRNLLEITIPQQVTSIGYEVFQYASLQKATILNPECVINPNEETFPTNTVLYGYKPSTAHDYAVENGRSFVNLQNGSTESNAVTYEGMLQAVPKNLTGEPTYQTTDVIHEPDTSRKEYVQLKQFTDTLVAGCATDYEKAETICKWVHGHITYQFGRLAGNTIDSVYALFSNDAPRGNCMAYTRLTAYMLYLSGIHTLEVINEDHEWCMAYIGNEWLIIDATNDIITKDYSNRLYQSPAFMSFSDHGNIYSVKSNGYLYLTGINYGQLGTASAKTVLIPDYVSRIDSSVFLGCSPDLAVICNSSLEREIQKVLPCVIKEGNTLTAKPNHVFGDWSFIGNTSEMERICSRCSGKETKLSQLYEPIWYGQKEYTDAVGKQFLLGTKCFSGGEITYKSNNEDIASVSADGTVTLKAEGTATITLSAQAVNQYEASECIVTVKAVAFEAPKISGFETAAFGTSGKEVRVTISWEKVKGADSYCICYGAVNDEYYGVKYVREDGESTKKVSMIVSTYTDASNIFWIEAYNETADITSVSEYQYYTAASVSLSQKTYTYNGKAKSPSVTVKMGNNTLKANRDYTVSYSKNKAIGKASVSITLKGNYRGKLSASFTILPPKTTLSSVKKQSASAVTVKWKKSSYASGYQIQYAKNEAFTTGKTTVTVAGGNNISKKITGLQKGKTYYVRIRVYKTVSGKRYYSGWSKVKKVKM